MPQKALPSKYYLSHFVEFVEFIRGPCETLLDAPSKDLLNLLDGLEEDTLCTFVRSVNRKYPIIRRKTLLYDEISDGEEHIQRLLNAGIFRPLRPTDYQDWYAQLTKPDLLRLMKECDAPCKSSTSKGQLIESAIDLLTEDGVSEHPLLDDFIVRATDGIFSYWLFLFFGDLHSGLNKFSMRDLGVMSTRQGDGSHSARFSTLSDAQSSYFYAQARRAVNDYTVEQLKEAANNLKSLPEATTSLAQECMDRYLFKLGKRLQDLDIALAMDAWARSGHPDATEKWVRFQFQQGNLARVQEKLENIIANPDSEHLLLFAEDFLARKFNSKKTSVLTDMLRGSDDPIAIDEMYRDSVEAGVIRAYSHDNTVAFHTENNLWQTLFGLTFWTQLFELDANALRTEFDVRPRLLLEKRFYRTLCDEVEARLACMTNKESFIRQLIQSATKHYGKPNGMFVWQPNALQLLTEFIRASDLNAIKVHLRAMSQRYHELSDGYPDLLIIDDKGARFEEVKAPGDQLRKNQLVTIRALQQAGFNVGIRRVKWWVDPEQTYVVVDIETTGGKPDQHRITEVGMVKIQRGKEIGRWQSLINPQRHIPRFITDLTGISNQMVADAPIFADVADDIERFCQDSIFVAHNVNFDYGFIRHEFARLERRFKMPKLCTVREMKKAYPGLPSYSLANLTNHFEIKMERHHRALSDALAASELLNLVNDKRMDSR